MSAPNVNTIRYARARIIVNPSTTAGDPPYGGTYLGLARDIEAVVTRREYRVSYEEYGGITGRLLEGIDTVEVSATMRGADADAFSAIFGTTTPGRTVATPIRYAEDTSARRPALLVMPFDQAQDAIYLPRAIGAPRSGARTTWGLSREWTYPVVWVPIPDAGGDLWQLAPLESLTL